MTWRVLFLRWRFHTSDCQSDSSVTVLLNWFKRHTGARLRCVQFKKGPTFSSAEVNESPCGRVRHTGVRVGEWGLFLSARFPCHAHSRSPIHPSQWRVRALTFPLLVDWTALLKCIWECESVRLFNLVTRHACYPLWTIVGFCWLLPKRSCWSKTFECDGFFY